VDESISRVCALANAGHLSRGECAGRRRTQACGGYVRQRTYNARHVSVAYVELVEDRSVQVHPGGHAIYPTAQAVAELQAGGLHVARAFHPVEARCARWLRRARDRLRVDEFELTHEALAQKLDVPRVGVTLAAGNLQRSGCITYSRDRIRILDSQRLAAAACECYRVADRNDPCHESTERPLLTENH
jgi:Crp-like helix-turn-helix protein